MDTLNTTPSFDEVAAAIRKSAPAIAANISPDFILGVSRGGLVPAVMLSHALGISMVPVNYSSELGKGESSTTKQKMLPLDFPPNSRLLLVDDISDSGYTLAELRDFYQTHHHYVYTLVLFNRVDTSIHIPDWTFAEATASDGWIVFPWEQ